MHWIALICNVYTSNDAFYFESETDSFLLFQSSYAEDTFVYFKYPTLPYIIFYILYIYIYICFIIYIYIYIFTEIYVSTNQHSLYSAILRFNSRCHLVPGFILNPCLGSTSLWRLDAIYLQRHLSRPQLRLAQPSGWKNPSESAWPNWGWISCKGWIFEGIFQMIWFRPFLNLIF